MANKKISSEWKSIVRDFLIEHTDKAKTSTPVTDVFAKFRKYSFTAGNKVPFGVIAFGRMVPAMYKRQPRRIRGKICRAFIHRSCTY
jgi:hypothetical protein